VENTTFDEESVKSMIKFGNSFANEIIVYLEKYIDDSLRQEIKLQYKMDLREPNYESILKESDDCFPLNVKNDIILRLLYDILKEGSNLETRKKIELIKERIEIF
jgi:hypothetical protein